MRIGELFQPDSPVISFEFFPPKTEKGYPKLLRTIEELKALDPGFVSVTMGAGGSTRSKTTDLVIQIQRQLGITAMAHLPCVGFERAKLTEILDLLDAAGIQNVLALHGDPPAGDTDFVPAQNGFDAGQQLSRAEGFDHVVVGAARECGQDRGLVLTGGEH